MAKTRSTHATKTSKTARKTAGNTAQSAVMSRWQAVRAFAAVQYARTVSFARTRKIWLFAAVVLLFIALFATALITNEPEEQAVEQQARALEVKAMTFGESQIEEDAVGVIKNLTSLTLVAQSAGPVQSVKSTEGARVQRGTVLVQQESAYAAGNAAAIQAQIAGKNYDLAQESLKATATQVSLNREQAEKVRENTEELRKIAEESIDETKTLISLSEEIVESIEKSIENAQSESAKDALKSQLLAAKSGLFQSRSALRSLEYQVSTESPQYDLADIQKQLIFETTELQLKSAQIQKDIAYLGLRSAQIGVAATRVTAPIAGTVERILVQPGQFLSPGTPVAVVKGETKLSLEIQVAGRVALQVDPEGFVTVDLGSQQISLPITHVSSAPINGQMYQVIAEVPAQYATFVYENQTVPVTLPMYDLSIDEGHSFIPLDALFVSNTGSSVFIVQDGTAVRKEVETGEIVGTSIEVKTGLMPGEIVILDRRVIDQQQVEYELVPNAAGSYVELG